MTTSPMGIKVLEAFEGLRLKAYTDSAGLLSIGYGHLITPEDAMGEESVISQQDAEDLLIMDLAEAEHAVNSQVIILLSQRQFDALVCLVYNIGSGAFRNSTIRKRLNVGDYEGAASAWTAPATIFNKAGGKITEGLTNRRKAERKLFEGTE